MPDQQQVSYSDHSDLILQVKRMDLDSGLLGKVFGSSKNAPLNIAGIILLALVVPGMFLLFLQGQLSAKEYWSLITPAVTLILGYVFGRKSE